MSLAGDETALAEKDELLHRPTDEAKWRESYYFNWADIENRISGFSTIGFVPNEMKRELVLVLFVGDRTEVHYQEPALEKYTRNINAMLHDDKLSYKLVRPFKEWQITYSTRRYKFNLIFKTRFPTYNFATDSSGSWHHHFEASGTVSGRLEYPDGKATNFKGYGQRDKSWGHRDWHKFDRWFAGQFQFADWTCAFRKDYVGRRIDLSGYVATKEGSCRLTAMEVETIDDADRLKTPLSSRFVFADAKENRHTIESERIGKNTYFRFARPFRGGYTELFEEMVIMKDKNTGEIGSGMAEYLRTFKK